MKKHLREAVRDLADLGLELIEVTQTKHFHLIVQAPDGRRMTYRMPVSPSDYRNRVNRLSDLRRFAKGPH